MPALLVCLISPILITFFSFLIFKEKVNRIQVLGFIIASLGAFLLITGGDLTQITPVATNFVGTLLAAATPVLWTIYSLFTKQLLKYKDGFQVTCYTTYLGTFGLFVITIFSMDFDQWIFALAQIEVLVSVLYLAAGCAVFGYLVWNQALGHLPSANVGAIFYVEPFITVLFAWIFLRELISPYSLLGSIIVLLAIALITWRKTGQKGVQERLD
jgi:drug/metabolite transporter (DMT)-like permease